MRVFVLRSHCIDAGRATAQYALKRGHSLFIVPGGEHEQAGPIGGGDARVWLVLASWPRRLRSPTRRGRDFRLLQLALLPVVKLCLQA